MFTGILSLPDGVRLSDFLNSPEKFFKFSEASTSDGVIEQMNDIFVNKEAIKFVKTTTNNDGRGLGQNYYLHIKNIPVRTKMLMTDYELSGNLYSRFTEDIAHLLETKATFLPCTEARVRHLNSNVTSDVGFVAVNRSKVYRIETEQVPV